MLNSTMLRSSFSRVRVLTNHVAAGTSAFHCTKASPLKQPVKAIQTGDWVSVHYTGTLDDGSVFDSSRQPGRDPLEFVVGSGAMIRGFDQAVTGLTEGGKRVQQVAPEDAYGQPNTELVLTFPRSTVPQDLKEGTQVQLSNGMKARVTSITDREVQIDMNHELAGKTLNFDVEVLRTCPGNLMQKAAFGAGCFWSVELAFQRIPGVLSTEVGYSNGFTDKPTYEDVCGGRTGHVEVVHVTYNPSEVSLAKLLDVFWDKHDPTTLNRQGGDVGTQYRSGIYYYTEEQGEQARLSLAEAQKKFKSKITTEIVPIAKYQRAEEYHQQYLAKGGRFGDAQSAKKGCTDPIRCYG